MKARSYLWIFSAAVILSVAVWILRDRSPTGADPSRPPVTKRQLAVNEPVKTTTTTAAAVIARLEEKDRRRLEAEGERLVNDARDALDAGDLMRFRQLLDEIIYRYKGDPNPLVLEFSDLLEHDDPQLRIRAAGLFLLTNLKAAEAVQVLRDIVRIDEPLMYGPETNELLNEEFPPSDYRFRAADILALYRIEEAREDVWALYHKTASKELISSLRRLNDPRMIEELKESALKKLGTIENMKLIGEFRVKEGRIQTSNEYRRRDSSVSGLIGSWFLARFAATRDVADGRA